MRRLVRAALVASALLLPSVAGATGYLGAYIWGGVITSQHASGPDSFYDSVNYALVNGFDTVRFMVGPNTIADYNLPSNTCSGNLTLNCIATVMLNSTVWDNTNLKRVIITSQDFVCSSTSYEADGLGCMNASVLTAHSAAIQADYAGLLTALKARFGSRSIQFVLSNWEGDNMVYCGDAFSFAFNPSFPATCKATWPSGQTNAQRAQALLQWFSIKDAAVSAFLTANPTYNVIHAPEFSSYDQFSSGCNGNCTLTDNVWNQIRLAGGRTYCSYSSYNTQGPANGTYLTSVQDIIARACTNLQIGEAGYDMTSTPLQTSIDLFKALDQLRNTSGVLGVIPWNFVGGQVGVDYGLFTTNGAPHIINNMGPLRPLPIPAPQQQIR